MTNEEAINRIQRALSVPNRLQNLVLIDEESAKMAIEALSADRQNGEWIMHIDDLFPEESTQECSNCHEHENIKIRNDNYCPNCGVDMRGEKK